ncbi:hypothetical protein GOP47_0011923 [Adiantum capillus-veneris]|uniref:DDE Tnp4 domain-containing protein n=1 Tax=Adiantum capillus-veneris TaxID=13818 RepID=A0A9D4UU80_ADICA|nr:hypothetical protein GOP47_0011923 [Adiantum capillus-veneris]
MHNPLKFTFLSDTRLLGSRTTCQVCTSGLHQMDVNRTVEQAIGVAIMAATIALKYWLETMEVMDNSYHFDDFDDGEVDEDIIHIVLAVVIHLCLAASALAQRHRKSSAVGVWYVKPRSRHFWQTFLQYTHGDEVRFEENARIPRSCFSFFCNLVANDLQQKPIPLQIAEAVPSRVLSVKRKVAMSLHLLGIGGPVHNVANMYGMGRSTVSRVFRQFITAIVKHKSSFIHWPRTPLELEQVKRGFEAKQGFPNCCGAIDVTHINMDLPPGEVQAHWFDRNHNYSMTLQAIVDSDMRFMDILCGMPGVCNDIRILRNSTFYMRAQSNVILNGTAIPFGRQLIWEYILGDGGYLNLPWLVIPFPASDIDEHTQKFNFKLSSTRIAVERTFGRLKQMWGYLHQRIKQPYVELLPRIIATCCILHNIWLQFGITYDCDEPGIVEEQMTQNPRPNVAIADDTREILFSYMRAGHMD